MDVTVKQITTPMRACNAARFTWGKAPIDHEPSAEWWHEMLVNEHSPIRLVEYDIQFTGIPRFVADHLVRYGVGCEPFMQSQRPDIDKSLPKDRSEMSQAMPTNLQLSVNAQTLIWMARQRLCHKASKETRDVIRLLKAKMTLIDPVLASVMVPNCIYRSFCPEGKRTCGYADTMDFVDKLAKYRIKAKK